MREMPLSDRLCDILCIAFALWTLCSHVVVAAGGVLLSLILFYAVAASLLALTLVVGLRKKLISIPPPRYEEPPAPRKRQAIHWIGMILGPTGALAFYWHGKPVLLWWWVAAVLGMAAVSSTFVSRPIPVSPARGRRLEGALWVLAAICVVVALIAHRYDPDDSVYVNFAVAAADLPDWPLLSTDTLHGIEKLPLHLPAYRLHSYELLNGALSYLTGIPAIFCFHWISAALAALFVPLAFAKLFRQLTPRTWLASTACVVIVLLAVGGIHRWYGNFAFVRMWQGKSVFLSLFLPLIYAYGIRFSLHPTRWNWALLAAAQIAALGCSSSAVWSAPASAVMAVAAVLRPRWKDLGTLVLGVLSSTYVLVAGLYLKSTIHQAIGFAPVIPDTGLGENLDRALVEMLGDGGVLVFGILSMTAVWALYPSGLARRFSSVLPFVVWSLFLNPYWDTFLIHNLVGPSYWRIMWALPLPILMALFLASPLGFRAEREKRGPGGALVMILVIVLVLLIPRSHGLSIENRVSLKIPDLKVWDPTYSWARALVEKVSPRSRVVVPDDIGLWIPTFHNHPYPLTVRTYLHANRRNVEKDDYLFRRTMTRYVSGDPRSPTADEIFREGLRRYDVEAVIVWRNANTRGVYRILRASDFGLAKRDPKRELWLSSEIFESGYLFGDGFEDGDLREWYEGSDDDYPQQDNNLLE